MSAFFVASVRITNPDKFQDYAEKAGPTFAPHGGQLLIKGKLDQVLTGEASNQTTAIVKFPHMDALNDWYNSDAYQAIIPLRDSASDITIVAYNEPPA
jgi:uncharacterized protein (DUF1330 family)